MSMNVLNRRGSALEDDYFRHIEQQQLERLRRREESEHERERLSIALGITDQVLLEELRELSFSPETAVLLELVPMVEMAWAEGSVQGCERKEIVGAVRRRGVESNSAAYKQLAGWLEHRPSDEFFARSRRAIKSMLQQLPSGERELRLQSLLAGTYRVAKASGGVGFFSVGNRVCREEEATYDRIIHDLQPDVTTEPRPAYF